MASPHGGPQANENAMRPEHALLNAPIKQEVEDETPFGTLCDTQMHEDRLSTASYAIGMAVQGAFHEAGGVAWHDGRVVSKGACSVTVQFDQFTLMFTMPEDGNELRVLRSDAPARSERSVSRGGTAQLKRGISSDSDAADSPPGGESGSDASYRHDKEPPKGKRRESKGKFSTAASATMEPARRIVPDEEVTDEELPLRVALREALKQRLAGDVKGSEDRRSTGTAGG